MWGETPAPFYFNIMDKVKIKVLKDGLGGKHKKGAVIEVAPNLGRQLVKEDKGEYVDKEDLQQYNDDLEARLKKLEEIRPKADNTKVDDTLQVGDNPEKPQEKPVESGEKKKADNTDVDETLEVGEKPKEKKEGKSKELKTGKTK